jgi:endonuclease-8
MPEGDTIWRTAATLQARLAGRTVLAVRPPALDRLRGARLEVAEPAGKHLLMRFSCGWTLHSHMRMNGSWHLYRPGERWRKPGWRAKAVLEFGEWVAVCFSAPVVELVRDQRHAVGHLGPDVLAEDFSVEAVVARARATGVRPLGELLLDQVVCAGIGNVFKCEALWEMGRSPWRSSAELSDEELGALFAAARRLMRQNLGRGAVRRFGERGRAAVHGRRGRPCPRCGTLVAARPQGEHARWTYWCPGCQL